MGQWFTNFGGYTVGTQPSDWQERWNNTGTPWSVQSVTGTLSGKALQFTAQGDTNTVRAFTWNVPGLVSGDAEIVFRFRRTVVGSSTFTTSHVGRLHVGGSAGSHSAYTGSVVRANGAYQLHKYVSGTGSFLATSTSAISNDIWYWMRLQRTGTTIQVRRWQDGTTEPGTWDFSVTDTSLSSGYIGVGTAGNADTFVWDRVGIGTAGDAAPTTSNTAPTITTAPTVSYGILTRLGPNNTPAVVTFTATDAEQTGTLVLPYTVRTAVNGGGTLVGSGNATSGVSRIENIDSTDPGLVNGPQTLYLRVSDGSLFSADSAFTLLRDTGSTTVGVITHSPNPVTGGAA